MIFQYYYAIEKLGLDSQFGMGDNIGRDGW